MRYTIACLALLSLGFDGFTTADEPQSASASTGQPRGMTWFQLVQLLDGPCPTIDFPKESLLSEVLLPFENYLATAFSTTIPLIPDVSELELEGITSLDEVLVPPVSLSQGSHSCWQALELIFEQTSEPRLTFVPRDGHVLVTTLAKAESDEMLVTHVYEVSFLAYIIGTNPTERSRTSNGGGNLTNGFFDFSGSGFFGYTPQSAPATESGSASRPRTGKRSLLPSARLFVSLVSQQTSPPALWVEIDGKVAS